MGKLLAKSCQWKGCKRWADHECEFGSIPNRIFYWCDQHFKQYLKNRKAWLAGKTTKVPKGSGLPPRKYRRPT